MCIQVSGLLKSLLTEKALSYLVLDGWEPTGRSMSRLTLLASMEEGGSCGLRCREEMEEAESPEVEYPQVGFCVALEYVVLALPYTPGLQGRQANAYRDFSPSISRQHRSEIQRALQTPQHVVALQSEKAACLHHGLDRIFQPQQHNGKAGGMWAVEYTEQTGC